jgi:heat-inducible transcriptional repressor
MKPPRLYITQQHPELSERQERILVRIIDTFIATAVPVGSRFLSKVLAQELALSAATLRNEMSDLESMGYLTQPHTSAGRVPTDKGYRFYVDKMQPDTLSANDKYALVERLRPAADEGVLRDASRIMGALTRTLAIVEIPLLSNAVIRRIEALPLSSTRLLVVVSLQSDIVRTLTLETTFSVEHTTIQTTLAILNERLAGKTLDFVRNNLQGVVQDISVENDSLLSLFVDSAKDIFAQEYLPGDRFHLAGTQHLFSQPEFERADQFRAVVELMENEDVIVHLLHSAKQQNGQVQVLIGTEMQLDLVQDYSLIVAQYAFSSAIGTIGLLGPKRMNYARMCSVVDFVAHLLSHR